MAIKSILAKFSLFYVTLFFVPQTVRDKRALLMVIKTTMAMIEVVIMIMIIIDRKRKKKKLRQIRIPLGKPRAKLKFGIECMQVQNK